MNDNSALLINYIDNYRKKLLDLSKRNTLISFKHSERSHQQIRIIDTVPEAVFAQLSAGKKLAFYPLPEIDADDADEETHSAHIISPAPCAGSLDERDLLSAPYRNDSAPSAPAAPHLSQNRQDAEIPRKKKRTNKDIATECGINPDYDLPALLQEYEPRKFLQTLLQPAEMTAKLSKLESYIRTDSEESGVNTLYAAFLFLECYESKTSGAPVYAPLILMPLELNKQNTPNGYKFEICSTGEEAELNKCIAEKLKREFGIDLPQFNTEERPEEGFPAYCESIEKILQSATSLPQRQKWRLRRFLTIGRFHFARLVMHQDLDDANWPEENSLIQNPILESLLAKTTSGGAEYAVDYDIDALEKRGEAPVLITEADASQHSAVADVRAGKNLAIQGPPGTGKSQTIANIIANALADNKKVLFLAEKMAALNVVYDRLNHAGLGAFCLELHSAKARKTEILKSLKERLEMRPIPPQTERLNGQKQEFIRQTGSIKTYTGALNQIFGRGGKTVRQYLLGLRLMEERLKNIAPAIRDIAPPFEEADLTAEALGDCKKQLAALGKSAKELEGQKSNGTHPWHFIRNFFLNSFEREDLEDRLADWRGHLQKLIQTIPKFLLKDDGRALSFDRLTQFLEQSKAARSFDTACLEHAFLRRLRAAADIDGLRAFIGGAEKYAQIKMKLRFLQTEEKQTAEALSRIEKTARSAESAAADTMSAKQLEEALEKQALREDMLLKAQKMSESIKKILEIKDDLTAAQTAKLLELPGFIAAAPFSALQWRGTDITEASSGAALDSACLQYEQIKSESENLAAEINLTLAETPETLEKRAQVLARKSAFSFFSSSYRQTKTFYAALSKNKKFTARRAADNLRTMAKINTQRRSIAKNRQLAEICGGAFRGADTDFVSLARLNDWTRQIFKNYSISEEFSAKLRAFLLTAEKEKLAALREFAEDKFFPVLSALYKTVSEENSAASTDKLAEKERRRTEILRSALLLLNDISAGEAVNLRDIAAEAALCREMLTLARQAEENSVAKTVLGEYFAGINTDITALKPIAGFADLCRPQPLLEEFLSICQTDFPHQWENLLFQTEQMAENLQACLSSAQRLSSVSAISFAEIGEADWRKLGLSVLADALKRAAASPARLDTWLEYHKTLENIGKATPCAKRLTSVCAANGFSFQNLPDAFAFIIYRAICKEILRRNPELEWRGSKLEPARSRIRDTGKNMLRLNQHSIRAQLSCAHPSEGNNSGSRKTWTEAALLYNETEKKKRHIPIRDLLRRAGHSILAIKPCFLMSPLTVAQYLTPGGLSFDLLVIDEASQMRPEEALGGIARARQIVVVGDPKQLPPTSFFHAGNESDDGEEDTLPDDDIMQLALTAYRPGRILTRHYRSRHESLIAFSNRHFYDNKLMLFPSPQSRGSLGLTSHYVGGIYQSSCNRQEVMAVTAAALAFMREHPEKSLGIAAMNQAQQSLIEIEMDKLFAENEFAENYRLKWKTTLEPFFVKNLENIQGDERDAIFVSTVYGPEQSGGAVMQRFGPINQTGGERRLNVLFSRAKESMSLFTSLKPDDIKISEGSSKGIRAFKGFLSYAKTGILEAGEETGVEPDSPFEEWVKEKLESIGCEAVPQVGAAGYRIDLGVRHPRFPYGYLLGIECDGAAYHSSKSARERDIIRQDILEGLGWNIYRIWSSDWFSDPAGEFEKLKYHIYQLLEKSGAQKSAAGSLAENSKNAAANEHSAA